MNWFPKHEKRRLYPAKEGGTDNELLARAMLLAQAKSRP
jgi:hypothetical protein